MRTEPTYQPPNQELDRTKLAAFIDGRLAGAERDAVLARVADSPDDLAIIADALAVQAELEAGVKDIRDYAPATRWSRPPRMTKWMGIAASIVAVATLPLMPFLASFSTVDGYANLLTSHAGLVAGWDSHTWSATRGANDGIPERVRAVRVGALTSALDVAAARQDSVTRRIAEQIAALLDNVSGAGVVTAAYRHIADGSSPASSDRLRDSRHEARRMVTASAFDDGAWLEAARIAAKDHDARFFTATASRKQLRELAHETANDVRTQEDLKAVSTMVDAQTWNWNALANSTENILAQLGAL
jgi:hypothetical protein